MEIDKALKFEGLKQPRSNRDRWCVPCTRENPPNELRTEYFWVVGSMPSQDPAQPNAESGNDSRRGGTLSSKPPPLGPTEPAPNPSREPLQWHSNKEGCEAGAAGSEEAARAPNPVCGTPEASGPTPPRRLREPRPASARSHLARELTPAYPAERGEGRGRDTDAQARIPWPE